MSRISGLDDEPITHGQELDLGHGTGDAPLGPDAGAVRGPVRPLPDPVNADGMIEAGHDPDQAESPGTARDREAAAKKAGGGGKGRGHP